MAKKVLGKGLDALIPQAVMETLGAARIIDLRVNHVRANPYQPRKHFDEDKLRSLADSIGKEGLLQPVVVRKAGKEYELIMGERRLQAARMAGISTVPAIVKEVKDIDSLRLALAENLHREDLNPLEVADAYKTLSESLGLSITELAGLVGRDRSSVANTLRLLGLPEKVKDLLRENKISEGHARAVLALKTEAEQVELALKILNQSLTVRQAETEAGVGKQARRKKKHQKQKPAHIAFLENAISKHLGTRVMIEEKRGGKGKMTIEFYSHEDFERLAEVLNIPLPR